MAVDNWRWSYHQGREERIAQETAALMNGHPFNPNTIPLHSHDGTMQSYFAKGWRSINSPVVQRRVTGKQHFSDIRARLAAKFAEVGHG